MLTKLTIDKVLNIGNIIVIVNHNYKSRFGKKFFKSCCKYKPCKF